MAFDRRRYLKPSGLCDFDRSPGIRRKAQELAAGFRNRKQKFESIFHYVKELPYGLEDWDLKASDTLKKGWGMCSGKDQSPGGAAACRGHPCQIPHLPHKGRYRLMVQVKRGFCQNRPV